MWQDTIDFIDNDWSKYLIYGEIATDALFD